MERVQKKKKKKGLFKQVIFLFLLSLLFVLQELH